MTDTIHKEGYALAVAIVLIVLFTTIIGAVLSQTNLGDKEKYWTLAKIEADDLSRTGLESVTTHLRNLAVNSIEVTSSGSTPCSFLPRVGNATIGGVICNSNSTNLQPANIPNTPFSFWLSLPQIANSPRTEIENDANACGISSNLEKQSAWPNDLIRNLATTFYIPGGNGQVGGLAQSSSILNTINLGVLSEKELSVDPGFTLESWVYMPGNSTTARSWQRIFDIGNDCRTNSSSGNCPNSNIVLGWMGTTGQLIAHRKKPTGELSRVYLDGDNDEFCSERRSSSPAGCETGQGGLVFPSNIWTHVAFSVHKDKVILSLYCSDRSKEKGTNNSWSASDAPRTSGTAITSIGNVCSSSIGSHGNETITVNNRNITLQKNEYTNPVQARDGASFVQNISSSPSSLGGSDRIQRLSNSTQPYRNSYVGRSNWTQDGYTLGYFHNTRVWKKALNATEIATNIDNDLEGKAIEATSSAEAGSALNTDAFLRSSVRMSPRYDFGKYWLRYLTVMQVDNPNNLNGQSFSQQWRVISCAISKELPVVSTHSTVLRYGVDDTNRGKPINFQRF